MISQEDHAESSKTGPSWWCFKILACTELSSGFVMPLIDRVLMALPRLPNLVQCKAQAVDTEGALKVAGDEQEGL